MRPPRRRQPTAPDAPIDPCRPSAAIVQLTYSTDGKRLAIAGADGQVTIVDLAGTTVRSLPVAEAGASLRVALIEDGGVLASAAAGAVKLWRVADGKLLHHLPVGTGDPVSLKFSDSPTPFLLAGFDRQANPADNVRVWRAADGILVGLMTGSAHATFTYADEAVLLLDEAARQYEVRSFGGTLRRQAALPMPLARTAFAADGAYLGGITGAGGEDERVAILSVADDQFVLALVATHPRHARAAVPGESLPADPAGRPGAGLRPCRRQRLAATAGAGGRHHRRRVAGRGRRRRRQPRRDRAGLHQRRQRPTGPVLPAVIGHPQPFSEAQRTRCPRRPGWGRRPAPSPPPPGASPGRPAPSASASRAVTAAAPATARSMTW